MGNPVDCLSLIGYGCRVEGSSLKRIVFAAALMAAPTVVNAEMIAVMQQRQDGSDVLVIQLSDQLVEEGKCPGMKGARFAVLGMGSTRNPLMRPIGNGCWFPANTGNLVFEFREFGWDDTRYPMVFSASLFKPTPHFKPHYFKYDPRRGYVTSERQSPDTDTAKPEPTTDGPIVATILDKMDGIEGHFVLNLHSKIAACQSHPGDGSTQRLATMEIVTPKGDVAEVVTGCWNSNGNKFLFQAKKRLEDKELFLVFGTAAFKQTEHFKSWN